MSTPSIHPQASTPQAWLASSRWFWGILATVTIWKLFSAWKLGLIFDECYYWEWALHPQACYFDHPPLTAWLIASAKTLLGHTTLAVRIWAVVSGIILTVVGRELGKDLFGLPAGNRAGILLILGVDHFLDMARSATNVLGNGMATAVISKWEGELS